MENHESDYYLFPIKPGVRNTLAGTMGELRSSHFHTGIDIRTGGVQGVPVQAAADGYISRISVSPSGYGNALYLKHPNGQTTVYAHLLAFNEELQTYLLVNQYEKQQFSVNLFPQKGEFSFQKGDTIAVSGNTGSSGGPHLHFDVRNDVPAVLNPLSFHFDEIIDTRPPEVREVAFITVGKHSRVNGQFGRFVFQATKRKNGYELSQPVQISGKVAVELYAFDRQDWTRFRTGINKIEMTLDDQPVFLQEIAEIPFSKSRNFYNHINFKELRRSGKRYHKLYVDDGNELEFYTAQNRGFLQISDTAQHYLKINMWDSYENKSFLTINIAPSQIPLPQFSDPDCGHTVIDNTLVVVSNQDNLEYAAQFHIGETRQYLMPDYTYNGRNVYLWNLLDGIPDSVTMQNHVEVVSRNTLIPGGQRYTYYSPHLEANFSSRTLFDSVYIEIGYHEDTTRGQEYFRFGSSDYPIRANVNLMLIPTRKYDKEKTAAYTVLGRSHAYVGGTWEGDNYRLRTREFGEYTLLTDSIPPTMRALVINPDRIVFRINDELSGIGSYEVKVNDEWVLMNYDPKKRQIWSAKLDKSKPFSGPMVITLTDNAGNEKVYRTTIK